MERKINKQTVRSFLLSTLFILSAMLSFGQQRSFMAGAATTVITPYLGGGIVGNFGIPPEAKNIHDELHARSIVLDDGDNKLAFIICDNIGLARKVCDVAKKEINERTGIPTSNILIAGTHTHSATSAEGEGPKRRGWNPQEGLDQYQDMLALRIADAVEMAIYRMEPAKIGWGSVNIPEHVFNRRWHMKDLVVNPFGEKEPVRFNPGIGNPDIVKPAGPTDPEVSFLSVQAIDGRAIALLANYSLHYIGGVPMHDISADYFAVFANRMQELLTQNNPEAPFVGIMTNGTSGDINNINVQGAPPKDAPYEKMKFVANDIAQKVYSALQNVKYQPWLKLQAKQAEQTLIVRKPTDKQLALAKQIFSMPEGSKPINHSLERTYAERITQLQNEWPNEISVVLQTFRIGDLQIAAIPFETFAESGLALKTQYPKNKTFTISFANGSYGYLPTPEQHKLGGYETWLGTNRVEVNASRKIFSTINNLFSQMN